MDGLTGPFGRGMSTRSAIWMAMLALGCDLPPAGDQGDLDPPASFAAQPVADPAPCRGGLPDLVHDAVWSCGPGGTWLVATRQDWICPDGQRRTVTWVHRTRIPCEIEARETLQLPAP
jgi:hypothetical protein